jgi:hypothetical protein
MENKKSMILPVYLNQKAVFDFLAIIEDGFTQIRSVERKENSENMIGSQVESSIGTGNAFGLFSLKLGAKLKGNNTQQDQQIVSEERIHTPTSLFAKLLLHLEENNLLKDVSCVSDFDKIETGNFLRIKGIISVNPLIKAFDSMFHMINMISSMNVKGAGGTSASEIKKTTEQIKKFNENMKVAGLIDLLQRNANGFDAVSQADIRFFENENIGILENGEYTVIGKVIKVATEETEPINLLRNTSLSAAGDLLIDQLLSVFQTEDMKKSGISIPAIKSRVLTGVLLIPIAIYA